MNCVCNVGPMTRRAAGHMFVKHTPKWCNECQTSEPGTEAQVSPKGACAELMELDV